VIWGPVDPLVGDIVRGLLALASLNTLGMLLDYLLNTMDRPATRARVCMSHLISLAFTGGSLILLFRN
jgi:hypothetical protein